MRIAAIIMVLTSMLACHTARQVRKIEPAVTVVDTTTPVALTDTVQVKEPAIAEDVFKKVLKNYIEYTTFNAKVRVQYESKEGGDEATAFIRVKKDSAVWISLRGALGIEGARVLVTRDSVKVLNFLKKNVQNRSIDYLEEVTDLPLDLATLQDIIIGNPVFIDSTNASQQVNANNELVIQMVGKIFKNLVTLGNSDLRILHSKLEDVAVAGKRTCEITFSNYDTGSGVLFSTVRKITVAELSRLEINLDFNQFAFNQAVTFPFNIPKKYKRL